MAALPISVSGTLGTAEACAWVAVDWACRPGDADEGQATAPATLTQLSMEGDAPFGNGGGASIDEKFFLAALIGRFKTFISKPRDFCLKQEEGLWRFTWSNYKEPVSRSVNNLLWSVGFRPDLQYRSYLLLLTFAMTSQAVGEVRRWLSALGSAANVLGPIMPRTKDDLLRNTSRALAEDGAGWGFDA